MKRLFNRKILTPLLSLLALAVVVAYFHFSQNPPQIGKIFGETKPGVLHIHVPDRVTVNSPFDIQVSVDSSNQNVNAVGFYLRFDPRHLELLDFDTSASFCQFYPEKKYSNDVGTMSLACGSPHPGFSGEADLITITFMPKLVTNTILSVDPKSQILLSDGKGTNILDDYPQVKISILNSL